MASELALIDCDTRNFDIVSREISAATTPAISLLLKKGAATVTPGSPVVEKIYGSVRISFFFAAASLNQGRVLAS